MSESTQFIHFSFLFRHDTVENGGLTFHRLAPFVLLGAVAFAVPYKYIISDTCALALAIVSLSLSCNHRCSSYLESCQYFISIGVCLPEFRVMFSVDLCGENGTFGSTMSRVCHLTLMIAGVVGFTGRQRTDFTIGPGANSALSNYGISLGWCWVGMQR